MEAEVFEQVPLELTRGLVGNLAAPEVGMDREAAEVGDPAPAVRSLETHRPRRLPVDLHDEHAKRSGLGLAALDLGADRLDVLRADCGEERLDVLVREEVDEE